MQVEVIQDLLQLAILHDLWNQAVDDSSFDSVFVTHEWFYCWAKNFLVKNNMYVVVARDGDTLLGIMPLMIEQRRRGMWTETILCSMSNKQTYKYNFVVRKDGAEAILAAMFQHLNQNLNWTSISLDFVPAPANTVSLLAKGQGKNFYKMRQDIHMESPYVTIAGSWNNFLDSRDRKIKKNLEYFERKLEKQGTAEIVSITCGVEIGQQIVSALDIEKSSWKGAQGTAIANSRNETNFYLDLGKAMSERGKFGLHFLTFNGNKIAFDYCLLHKDHFNVLKTGYDPDYSKNSPGRVLRKKMLQKLYEDGTFKTYDLLGASENWKAEWTDKTQTLLHIHLYNRRLISIIEYTALQSLEQTKELIRRHPRLFRVIKGLYLHLKSLMP